MNQSNPTLAKRIAELERQLSSTKDLLESSMLSEATAKQYAEEVNKQNAALAAQVKELKSELRQEKLIHIGFTNESQVQYVTEDKEEGAFYPNSDNGCYIPVYMLNVHAHRVGPDSKIYCTQLEQGKKIAEIRAEAGRDGFIAGYFHYKNYGFQFEDELEAASNQHHASILAGKDGE